MGLPVVWVWTHDSVGLGEDGPTHQPIEHYAALRAIPELWVIRPATRTRRSSPGRWRSSARTARSRCCSRARTSPCSTATRSRARQLLAARRLRAVGLRRRRRRARADPDLDRRRGADRRCTPRRRSRRAASRCASCRCRAWSCSRRSRRSTATRCCRPPSRARLAVEPGATAWLVEVGRHRRRRARPRPLRRLGAGHDRAGEARLHLREHRRPRARAARPTRQN